MPKKSAAARGGAQRNRPKLQKNIELVRPTTVPDEQALEVDQADETEDETNKTDKKAETTAGAPKATSVNTAVAPKAKSVTTSATRTRRTTASKAHGTPARLATSTTEKEEKEVEEEEEVSEETPGTSTATAVPATAPKSAAARLAARRQAGQKNQQRSAPTLVTAEHYSYVRKDLVFIAVLAAIMFATIIILHFVPGIGS
jgi:hypothetical protein